MYKLLLKNLEIFGIVIALMIVFVTHFLMVVPSVHIMNSSEQQFHAILNLVMGLILVGIFSRFIIFYLY
jgi:hypothetical protein